MVRTKVKKLKKLHIAVLFSILIIAFLWNSKEAEAAKGGKQQNTSPYIYISEWEQDVNLDGLFDSTTMYFQTGIWKVEEAELELQLNISRLINKEVSYFTVYLDNSPIKTISLSKTKKETVSYVIPLPLESLTMEGGHSIKVETYLRGQTTDACVDDSSISTWVNVLSDSKIMLKYRPTQKVNHIADFYQKFVSIESLEHNSNIIAVRNGTEDAVLTSMAHILTGFAQNTAGNYESIKAGIINTQNDLRKYPYVIYIDKYSALPLYLKSVMTEVQKAYAEKSAVICLVDYDKTKVLLVTGNNNSSLIKAGDILSNPVMIPTLKKTQVEIKIEKDYKTDPYKWDEYIPLTQYGTEIKGNFEQTSSFIVDSPSNKKLADSAQLSLDYRYSSNLNFKKSLVTVYMNGTPIGSRELTKEGADGTTELFSIPKDVNAAGSCSIETKFMLYPKNNWCELTKEELSWAYVADTSMLKWSTTENTEMFFEYYPFPFMKDGEFSKVKVLLPEKWNEDELKTMTSMLLTLGKWQKSNRGTLEVMTNPKEEDLKEVNIISIGDNSKNHMGIMEQKLIGDTGCAQLTISPYGKGLYGILRVTGENSTSIMKTLEFLGNSKRLWEIKGDLFYTDGENVNYRYIRNLEQEITELKAEVPFVEDENLPLAVVLSIMVLILLAASMILMKHGRRGESERK